MWPSSAQAPACDALTLNRTLDMALNMQPGDLAAARAEIAQIAAAPSPGLSPQEERSERELVLPSGLETAQHQLARLGSGFGREGGEGLSRQRRQAVQGRDRGAF